MNKRVFSLLLMSMMLASVLAIAVPKVYAQTSITVAPLSQEFGPASCVGTHFTVAVEVRNVVDLWGADIQFGWDETWIGYVGHHKHIPVETWPDGILHSPTIPVRDVVSEGVPMPDADPNSDYWLAEASMVPARPFDGSGIAFHMEFVILKQGAPGDPDKTLTLDITAFTLADNNGNIIAPVAEYDGTVVIHSYIPSPKLSVLPEEVSNIPAGNNFVSEIWLHAYNENTGDIVDLDPMWDVFGFDFHVFFDPTLIEVTSVTIDPDGWFAAFWPSGILVLRHEFDNAAGSVWIEFYGVPGDFGVHTAPFGQGVIAEVTFHSIYESATYPPPSCAIDLALSTVTGWPHPERAYPPWNGSTFGIYIEHFVNDAIYTSVRAVSIDIKPGSCPNSINPNTKGVVSVAILTTPNFDATTVDPSTVLFVGATPLRWTIEDVWSGEGVPPDGDLDLLLFFKTQDCSFSGSSASLIGETFGGETISGADSINLVP